MLLASLLLFASHSLCLCLASNVPLVKQDVRSGWITLFPSSIGINMSLTSNDSLVLFNEDEADDEPLGPEDVDSLRINIQFKKAYTFSVVEVFWLRMDANGDMDESPSSVKYLDLFKNEQDGQIAYRTESKFGDVFGIASLTIADPTDFLEIDVVLTTQSSISVTELQFFGDVEPTPEPTNAPSPRPSVEPTSVPTELPTTPTSGPSFHPSIQPSTYPSAEPTLVPTEQSISPSAVPSSEPSGIPSLSPTQPTGSPSSASPTPAGEGQDADDSGHVTVGMLSVLFPLLIFVECFLL